MGKRVVKFLFAILGLRVTFTANIYTVRQRNGPATTLLLEVFTQRNFVAEFIRFMSIFSQKMANLLFEPPFGGLTGNVRTSSIALWKARGRLFIRNN